MKYLKLIKLPDAKEQQHLFTVGKTYCILRSVGNGYVIENDQGQPSIVLKERFE